MPKPTGSWISSMAEQVVAPAIEERADVGQHAVARGRPPELVERGAELVRLAAGLAAVVRGEQADAARAVGQRAEHVLHHRRVRDLRPRIEPAGAQLEGDRRAIVAAVGREDAGIERAGEREVGGERAGRGLRVDVVADEIDPRRAVVAVQRAVLDALLVVRQRHRHAEFARACGEEAQVVVDPRLEERLPVRDLPLRQRRARRQHLRRSSRRRCPTRRRARRPCRSASRARRGSARSCRR